MADKKTAIGVLLGIGVFLIILFILGYFGYANILRTAISGSGSMDQEIYTRDKSLNERAIMSGGNFTYKSERLWGVDQPQSFTTSFIVTGASGGYKNQYKIQDKAADYGHVWRATKITDNFSTTSEIVTTATTLDSLVIMDGDNATFTGKIISAGAGGKSKPITEYEQTIIGKAAIEQYLNITKPIDTFEDWLAFCNTLDEKDVLPEGVYIAPSTIAKIPENITVSG